ncbi:MAG: shikimate kinase [Chrysiogenetes bacterium]|nr:shikimate kinase [Chrysiogenetes bacterium]
MDKPRNIVLVGFMGSGKSVVGRALASRLGWEFLDTDTRIEEMAGCSVGEIFDTEGEAGFRRCEREVLASLAKSACAVISTGGGIVLAEENWPLLRALGPVVCLEAGTHTTLDRVRGGRARRPLLEVEDPAAEIERLKTERAPHYARADQKIDTDGKSPAEVVDEILATLGIKP